MAPCASVTTTMSSACSMAVVNRRLFSKSTRYRSSDALERSSAAASLASLVSRADRSSSMRILPVHEAG